MKISRMVFAVFAALSLFAVVSMAADPSGTWKWSVSGPDGTPFETTLKLELKGDALSGTYSNQFGETAVTKATFKGDAIAFEVHREFNGNGFVIKYKGILKGDTIKGTLELPDMGDGASQMDWNAKRIKQ